MRIVMKQGGNQHHIPGDKRGFERRKPEFGGSTHPLSRLKILQSLIVCVHFCFL